MYYNISFFLFVKNFKILEQLEVDCAWADAGRKFSEGKNIYLIIL
jgi:hypothetical protein